MPPDGFQMNDRLQNIQAIFFDAGYTLFYIAPSTGEVFRDVYRQLTGIEVEPKTSEKYLLKHYRECEVRQHERRDYLASAEKTERFWYEIYQKTVLDLNYNGEAESLAKKMFKLFRQSKYYCVFPGVVETLERLKARGYRLGLISNYDSSLWQTLDDLKLKQYFDPILISVDVGYEKPHPRIFQKAIRQVELPPDRCAVVGDNLISDVQGAEAVGMKGILLDWYRKHRDKETLTRVENFNQLLELF